MTPDLQRIVEALKACRERYEIQPLGAIGPCLLWEVDEQAEEHVFIAEFPDRDVCSAYIDTRCAEAIVRAIREPSNEILAAGLDWAVDGTATLDVRDQWVAMCDAILGEEQP
jgi:hypothetical protein